mgnify:FL=1
MNDSLLALSYVEAYDISYPEALNRIADEVTEMRQTLENSGKFELNDIGTIILNEDGNYTFEPCEAGILTPELYGLGSLNMLPLAQISAEEVQKTEDSAASIIEMPAKTVENNRTESEVKNQDSNQKMESGLSVNNSVFVNEEDEESNAEFISIKKSWLRNIAAACIALIAFFTYSSPLGTPTVQKSQIDTGMLNRIMPKEINKVAQPQELVLSTESQAEESIPAKSVNMTQDNELQTVSSYYSIVLASRVTKRNAACYAELLQNKGFKEARVLITDNNVKVIYGTYSTEGEAYSALNRLHNYDAFTDGWITKVKE